MEQRSLDIAIIGAGNVGTALGNGWTKAGHRVTYGVRKPAEAARTLPGARSNADAARSAEVVVLATPWNATEAALRDCGDLTGKIVIDATNPLTAELKLDRGFTTSGAEQVARWAAGAQVFKAMNQIGYGLMDHPTFEHGARPVMFVAGDGTGRDVVLRLVTELGFEAVDAGALEYARLLEPLALLWIHLAIVRGQGRDFAFGVLRRR